MTNIQTPSYYLVENFTNWWERAKTYNLETITPVQVLSPSDKTLGGLPSVLISREKVSNGDLSKLIIERMMECQN